MVSKDFDEALKALWSAVRSDNPDEVEGCLITLDLEDGKTGSPSSRLFEVLLEVADYVCSQGHCAWQVFFWFERRYSLMSEEQKYRARNYIASIYGRIVDETTVLEVAEWIGRFGDDWALGVISRWIEERSTFGRYNQKCISSALSELLNDSYGAVDQDVRLKALQLSREYHQHRS